MGLKNLTAFGSKLFLFVFVIILCSGCGEPTKKTPTTEPIPEDPFVYNFPKNSFTDSRDNRQYKTVTIEHLEWFAENLEFPTENSFCYNDYPLNCQKWGRLYTWLDAREACPKGWRLPTRKDWSSIHKRFYRSEKQAYKALKLDGEAGFNSKLAGWRTDDGRYFGLDKKACFWSADEIKFGYSRYYVINKEEEKFLSNNTRNEFAFSCRCVRETNASEH